MYGILFNFILDAGGFMYIHIEDYNEINSIGLIHTKHTFIEAIESVVKEQNELLQTPEGCVVYRNYKGRVRGYVLNGTDSI